MTDNNNIFYLGFILGALFAYSGIMGFVSGCITGIIIAKNYAENKQFDLDRFMKYFSTIKITR
jgi:hypothetical protein